MKVTKLNRAWLCTLSLASLLAACSTQPTIQPASRPADSAQSTASQPTTGPGVTTSPEQTVRESGLEQEIEQAPEKEPEQERESQIPAQQTLPEGVNVDQVTPDTPLAGTRPDTREQVLDEVARAAIRDLCQRIGNKLGSVNEQDCLDQPFVHSGTSTQGLSLAYRDYQPLARRSPLGKVLVLGGIHGDEFSSVSVVFKWLKILDQHHSGLFHWRFVPVANPDGLLATRSQRQNARGVDLNRNFPTADWVEHAHEYWRTKTHRNPRRYPGTGAASEVETRWIIEQIDTFKPDVVISMHAPYHLVDYDGPPQAPENLGGLYLRKLGVYPGSLGNYVGVDLQKPIVTVELESAGILPRQQEIESMWRDLVQWLRRQLGP